MQYILKFLLFCIATCFLQQTNNAACKIKNAQQLKPNLTNTLVNEDDLDSLIKKGFDINAQDSEGNTLLHLACQLGYCSTIKKILDYPEVNLNKQNGFGITPLYTIMSFRVDCEATMNKLNVDQKDYKQVRDTLDVVITYLSSKGAVDNYLEASLDVILNHETRINEEQKQALKEEIMHCYGVGK